MFQTWSKQQLLISNILHSFKKKSISTAALKCKPDRYLIHDWREKKNDLQELSNSVTKKRKCLQGDGRKTMSEEMENQLLEWIFERHPKVLCVSRKLIR